MQEAAHANNEEFTGFPVADSGKQVPAGKMLDIAQDFLLEALFGRKPPPTHYLHSNFSPFHFIIVMGISRRCVSSIHQPWIRNRTRLSTLRARSCSHILPIISTGSEPMPSWP